MPRRRADTQARWVALRHRLTMLCHDTLTVVRSADWLAVMALHVHRTIVPDVAPLPPPTSVLCLMCACGFVLPLLAGYVHRLATNEWAYTVLCTVLSVVDDTAMLNKTLVPELKVGPAWRQGVEACLLSGQTSVPAGPGAWPAAAPQASQASKC